jgi:hypothetical protein
LLRCGAGEWRELQASASARGAAARQLCRSSAQSQHSPLPRRPLTSACTSSCTSTGSVALMSLFRKLLGQKLTAPSEGLLVRVSNRQADA